MDKNQKVKGFPTGDIKVKRALDFTTFEEFTKEANKLQGTTKDGDAKEVKLETAKAENIDYFDSFFSSFNEFSIVFLVVHFYVILFYISYLAYLCKY